LTSQENSIKRSMVAIVAPKRIAPTPLPGRIARFGPTGTGQALAASVAAEVTGAADALALADTSGLLRCVALSSFRQPEQAKLFSPRDRQVMIVSRRIMRFF
jgi:hypothetical protein